MKTGRLIVVCVAIFFLVLSSSVTLVFANIPTVLQIITEKRGEDTVITLTITHSSPSSNHYVDRIDIKVNGVLRIITDLQPQTTETFNYTYVWGKVDSIENVTARAHCNIHGWSSWAFLGKETPKPSPSGTPLNAAINLLVQIVIASILIVGVIFAKKKNFKAHGYIMTIAVVINAIVIITIMGPSMISAAGGLSGLPQILASVVIAHAALGAVSEGLGAILVFKKFGNVKMWMRIVFILWMISLALGILIYLLFYVI